MSLYQTKIVKSCPFCPYFDQTTTISDKWSPKGLGADGPLMTTYKACPLAPDLTAPNSRPLHTIPGDLNERQQHAKVGATQQMSLEEQLIALDHRYALLYARDHRSGLWIRHIALLGLVLLSTLSIVAFIYCVLL